MTRPRIPADIDPHRSVPGLRKQPRSPKPPAPPVDPLLSLAARVEAAEGPSEQLFVGAFHACYGKPPEAANMPEADFTVWIECWSKFLDLIRAKGWTDAALLLVPEGWWGEVHFHQDGTGSAEITAVGSYMTESSVAATPRARTRGGCFARSGQ